MEEKRVEKFVDEGYKIILSRLNDKDQWGRPNNVGVLWKWDNIPEIAWSKIANIFKEKGFYCYYASGKVALFVYREPVKHDGWLVI